MSYLAILIIGIFIGYEAPIWIELFKQEWANKKLLKTMTPTKAKDSDLCKGPHSWINAKTLTKEGITTGKVCRACGLISGTDLIASPESIDRIEENNKLREIEQKLYKQFVEKEEDEVKKYLAQELGHGLSYDKVAAIHNAGMTFNQRYDLFKAAKSEEIQKEITKVDA